MEREIKFRALVQYKGKEPMWIYYKPLTIPHAFYEDTTDCKIIVKDLQLTGILDKNGKEIYQGDIVDQYAEQEYTTRFVIEWYQKRCGFWMRVAKFDEEPRFDLSDFRENLVVVGNIYQNAELLTI